MRTREKRERPLTALKKMQFFHSILSEPCVVYGTAFLSNTIYQVRGGESIEIKKSEEELFFYEEKLGLAKKLKSAVESVNDLEKMAKSTSLSDEFFAKISELKSIISQ